MHDACSQAQHMPCDQPHSSSVPEALERAGTATHSLLACVLTYTHSHVACCVLCAAPPGAPGAANGLISEMFGVKSGPALVRSNCILAVAAGVCAPLVALR
jgi:hypothetical protein